MSLTTPEPAEIEALVGMLNETDTDIYPLLKDALFKIGEAAVPYLQNARLKKESPLLQNRLEGLLRELRLETACRKLSAWKREPQPNLLQGFYYLSSVFYPELSWDEVSRTFNRLHGDCWLLLASSEGLKERVVALNSEPGSFRATSSPTFSYPT